MQVSTAKRTASVRCGAGALARVARERPGIHASVRGRAPCPKSNRWQEKPGVI